MVSIGIKMRELVPLLPSRPTFATTPTTSKLMPFSRIVEPTAGRPGNIFLSSSQPTTATRRAAERLRVVLGIEPAAGFYRNVANLVVVGGHAENLAVGRSVVADCADVFSIQYGRQRAHELSLVANRQVIFIGEVIGLPGQRTAFDGRNPPRKHKHDVLSEGSELLFLAAAEPFSQAHQEQQGAHSQAIPNMVRNERSLCAHRVDSDCRTISRSIRIGLWQNHAPTPPGRGAGAPG